MHAVTKPFAPETDSVKQQQRIKEDSFASVQVVSLVMIVW